MADFSFMPSSLPTASISITSCPAFRSFLFESSCVGRINSLATGAGSSSPSGFTNWSWIGWSSPPSAASGTKVSWMGDSSPPAAGMFLSMLTMTLMTATILMRVILMWYDPSF